MWAWPTPVLLDEEVDLAPQPRPRRWRDDEKDHCHVRRRPPALAGPDPAAEPSATRNHGLSRAYLALRLSPLAHVYTKERAPDVCLASSAGAIGLNLAGHPNIHTDLEDRPQKTARPCVIVPSPTVVAPDHALAEHCQDYAGLLHGQRVSAAAARDRCRFCLHIFSALTDNALSETYALLCEIDHREPGSHPRRLGYRRRGRGAL